jgi:hypothetical protein
VTLTRIVEVADQRNPIHVSPEVSAEVVPSCVNDVSSSIADDGLPGRYGSFGHRPADGHTSSTRVLTATIGWRVGMAPHQAVRVLEADCGAGGARCSRTNRSANGFNLRPLLLGKPAPDGAGGANLVCRRTGPPGGP